MSRRTMLEIQNRTPYAMSWAHLEREDAPRGTTARNLLTEGLPSRRGRVVGEVEPGPARLVCGLETGDRAESVVGPRFVLEAGGATSACVRWDERAGFTVECADARAHATGEGEPAGPYRWNGRRGRSHDKRGRRLRAGGAR